MKRWTLWMVVLVISAFGFGYGVRAAGEPTAPATGGETTARVAPAADANLELASQTFAQLAERLSPSVVNIYVTQVVKAEDQMDEMDFPWREFFRPFMPPQEEFKRRGQGSGFVIDKDGYVVTNNHVVEDAQEIRVKLLDGREFAAEVVGTDPETDVALIKIKDPQDLQPIPLGDSDRLRVGEWVLAIGNPFGLSHTVTAGIVSAKGRGRDSMPDGGPGPEYQNFIQTDASINPGNSGGPLINIHGEVVGINTMIAGIGTGIGFAIPINMARDIVGQLKTSGKVTRGWLGVSIQEATPEIAGKLDLGERKGVLIGDVFKDSPAEKAGIKVGDVVLAVDGKKVQSPSELQFLIAAKPVGSKVKVDLVRKGKDLSVTVKLDARPAQKELASLRRGGPLPRGSESFEKLGMGLQDLTPEIARRLGLEENRGVLVAQVKGGSPAADAGLERGDVILEVNQEPVDSVADFRRLVAESEKGSPFLLLVHRQGRTFFVALKP